MRVGMRVDMCEGIPWAKQASTCVLVPAKDDTKSPVKLIAGGGAGVVFAALIGGLIFYVMKNPAKAKEMAVSMMMVPNMACQCMLSREDVSLD